MNKKNGSPTDDWNDDDCDCVSIVREVEREMKQIVDRQTGDEELDAADRSTHVGDASE